MTTTEKKRLRSPGQPVGRWCRPEKRLACYLRDRFLCVYCLRDLHDAAPFDITLDHVNPDNDPVTGRKNNHESNLVTACRACNCSRQNKPLNRFCGPETRAHIRRNCKRSLKPFIKLAKALISGETGFEETIKEGL